MNRTGLVIALAVAATVGLVFGLRPDLDLKLATLFFDPERGGFWRAYDPIYLRARDVAVWLVTLAPARAGLCNGTRLRSSRWNLAHGGRRAFLHGLDIRRRVQLSGDLARAWWALPLAAHARFGCGGGAAVRAVRAKTALDAFHRRGVMIRHAGSNIVPSVPGRA